MTNDECPYCGAEVDVTDSEGILYWSCGSSLSCENTCQSALCKERQREQLISEKAELEKRLEEAELLINSLKGLLPDSSMGESEHWEWCWNELDDESQGMVKEGRERAEKFLSKEQSSPVFMNPETDPAGVSDKPEGDREPVAIMGDRERAVPFSGVLSGKPHPLEDTYLVLSLKIHSRNENAPQRIIEILDLVLGKCGAEVQSWDISVPELRESPLAQQIQEAALKVYEKHGSTMDESAEVTDEEGEDNEATD